jgi:ribosomal protein L5
VKVRVSGGAALDLLQKLTYVVLPSQNGFRGVSSRSFDRAGNLHFRWVGLCVRAGFFCV